MTSATTVRTKWAKCEGGRWDRTRHIPGWRPRAVWYENDTAVPALTRNDRTGLGQRTQECLSLSLVWSHCLRPRGKHLLYAPGEFIKTFRSLWPRLSFTQISFDSSLSPCVWCVNTHTPSDSTDWPGSTEGKHTETPRACDSHQARDSAALHSLAQQIQNWDRPVELLTCVQTHYLKTHRVQTDLLSLRC